MVGSTSCEKIFEVMDENHFLLEAKKHYLTDKPHTSESSGNFIFNDPKQFDSDEGKNWSKKVFDTVGEFKSE